MKKYRKQFLIFALFVFLYLAIKAGYNFSNNASPGASFTGTLVYGIGVLVYETDLYNHLKRIKSNNSSGV